MKLFRKVLYGVCVLQLRDNHMKFLYGDEKLQKITGYKTEELVEDGFRLRKLIAPVARKDFLRTVCAQIREKKVASVEVELVRKDMTPVHVVCCVSVFFDPVRGEECVQAVVQDITSAHMEHMKMKEQIELDTMTRLYNKETIERIVNKYLDKNPKNETAFYLIDIDDFKHINDTFGHVFGDSVIQDFASTLIKVFPKRAKAGRIGGDEFVVFLPDISPEEARRLADVASKALQRELVSEIELVRLSSSIGVTMWEPGEDYQALVKKADAAMYFAKDSGKNQSVFFQESMRNLLKNEKYNYEKTKRGKFMEETYDVEFVLFAYQLLIDSKQFDSSMNLLLERMVDRYGIDRISVYEYQNREELLVRTNTGVNDDIKMMGEADCYMERAWLEEHVNAQGDLVANDAKPGENMPTFNNYITIPKSYVICSIKEQEEICGCVIFSQYQNRREWTPYEIKTFHELAKAVALFLSLRKDKQSHLEEINRLATRDKVTGLLDQKNFEKKLENYIRHCHEFECLSLIYVDISNFSYVNERYGIRAGDEVLSSFGKLLTSDSNVLLAGRLFSDCFLSLHINESREKTVERIMEGNEIILQVLQKKYPVANLQFKCGIYFLEDEECTVREAIENANMARKSIKEEGNSTYCIYTRELRTTRGQEQDLIAEALECIRNDKIELYLQPSFRLSSKEVTMVEVFGHWHNKAGKERKPKEIIPVLKKNGYILEWDFAVYKKVLKLMNYWREKGIDLPVMEVNFSTGDFQYAKIVEEIVNLTQEYEIDPKYIVIEVSEHGLRKAPKKVTYVLKELRKKGFRIAIDNFGNTYSSLEMLMEDHIDMIKTGKHFLLVEGEEPLRNEYLRYISSVVHAAQKEIIFVGAEDQIQEAQIEECGYNMVQGYLYEKELPADVFEEKYMKAKGV